MDSKKIIKIIMTLPPLILTTLYGSGYAAQFIRNYKEWEADGGALGSGTAPVLPSTNIWECFKGAFSFPYGIYGFFICVILFALLLFMIMKMGNNDGEQLDRDRNFTYSDKGTYGTSGFMTDKEREEVLELKDIKHSDGIILGKLGKKAVFLPTNTRMNRNIAVYGASGSMKSRAFARNMILQAAKRNESVIVTDPKSELYEDMSEYLRENGYFVKVFNLVNPENSDSWNCLSEIEGNEVMAQVFCDVVIKNTGSLKADHFWDNAEMCLLKAIVLYVERNYEEKNRNIGEVYKLLTLESEAALNELFRTLPKSHPAVAPYSIFKQASDSVRSGVIIGLGSRLQVFQNELIREITNYDEIELELPGREKCAYFIVTSDQDSTFDFLSSLMFSFLFIKLVRYADKHGEDGKLPVHVNMICDEFPNIGTIIDVNKKISTIRSRNLSISVVFQNLAQLQNRYPNNLWQEILGNCDTQYFLGCTDELTAKYISDRTGVVTVGVSSHAKQLNTWRVSNYTPEYRETSSIGKRNLLTPDEVLRLPLEEALIILRGQKTLRVEKFDYTLNPESKKLVKKKATDHIPEWFGNKKRPRRPKPNIKSDAVEKALASDFVIEKPIQPEGGDPVYVEPEKKVTKSDLDSIMS